MMNLDILKLIVVLIAIFYLIKKVKPQIYPLNYRLMNIGLFLLLAASILDYTDGIKRLKYAPIIGKKAQFHDFIEDQIFNTPGFALFALGAFMEIMKKNKRKNPKSH